MMRQCKILLVAPFALAVGVLAAAEPSRKTPALPPVYSYRAPDIEALRDGFANPPREAGPWVFWMWFDNVVTKEEITRELEEMAAAGIAGAELRWLTMRGFQGRPGPWFDPDGWARLGHRKLEFLSEEFLDVLEHTFAEAERLGLKLAINMGMGWPPGGTWITDEHRSKHLVSAARVVQGPKRLEGDEASVPPGAMVFTWRVEDGSPQDKCVVVESFRDLTDKVDAKHRLPWDVPKGRWLIGTFHYAPGGICDKGDGPEADPGSRKAVLFHLDHLFGKLQPRLGKHFGSTLVDVASDSWEYERSRQGRYWSPALFELSPEVAGYDLRRRLYALLGYGPDREQVLGDVDRVQRETVRRHFFAAAADFLHTRSLRHRPQAYGRGLARDFFEVYALADVPEIEEALYLPEAVWTAHTLGKPVVSVEALTFLSGQGSSLRLGGKRGGHGPMRDPMEAWETNPAKMRWFASAHFARGINRIQIHSFSYSPPGVPPPGWRMYAEIHLNRNVPWWPYMREFSRWIARNQLLLQSGGPVADALIYPVRSNPPNGPYNMATDQPVSAINAIDGASPYTLARLRKQGEAPYDFSRLVLIDDVRTPDEARRILELVDAGVVLVCCRGMPERWTALRPAAGTAGDIAGLRAGFRRAVDRGKIVDARTKGWQAALAEAQSVRWAPASAKLSFQHRRIQGGEIYFLTNWGEAFSGEVSFPHAELAPEIWDADTGAMLPAGQYRADQERTAVSLSLRAHESAVVVFTHAKPSLHALRCEGGRVAYGPDGKLCVYLDGPGPSRVELSDGRTRDLRVELPKPLPLDGRWTLAASPEHGVGVRLPVRIELDRLVSWREIPELRTYSGIASYTTQFDVSPDHLREDVGLLLELGDVYELADVWLNGRHVATNWFPPYRLDVTGHVRPGKNAVRIDVPNILKNHLEQGDYTRPSGLLGPVRIRPIGQIILKSRG